MLKDSPTGNPAQPFLPDQLSGTMSPLLSLPKDPGHAFGGLHNETACLRNLLARTGAIAPHTGEPWSEAMLCGLGGGVGLSYFILPLRNGAYPFIGLRHLDGNQSDAFLRTICRRLGVHATTYENPSEHAAENDLVDALAHGAGALVWTDRAALPYYRLPSEMIRAIPHVVGATRFDEEAEEFELDDRSASPHTLDAGRFRLARHSIASLQHRFLTISPVRAAVDPKRMVHDAISESARAQCQPPLRCFGLAGLHTWARMMTRERDAKGWPTLFPRGLPLFRALRSIFHQIETSGTGGGGFRPLYGDFLIECATVTGISEFDDMARVYHALGDAWTALAEAALPDEVPRLAEAKRALRRKYYALEQGGDSAHAGVAVESARLLAIDAEMALDFPLTERESIDRMGDLADRLEQIEGAERDALAALGSLTG